MRQSTPSRRTVLRAGGALGVAAVAGCLGDGAPSTGDASPADHAPAGSAFLLHAEVSTLLNDDQLRSRTNEFLQASGGQLPAGAQDVTGTLDNIESSTGLDPRALQEVTVFSGYEPDSPSGVRLEAGWAEADLREALAGDGQATTETYNGRTVYALAGTTKLAVLDENTYVLGTAAGVEGAIDVAAGDADPASGRVRDALATAPDGPLRFGFVSPPDLGEGDSAGTLDPQTLGAITHGYGAYVVDGDSRSGSVTLETDAAEAASTIAAQLRTAKDMALRNLEQSTATPELAAEVEALLTSIDVTADGSRVRVVAGAGEVLPVMLVAVLSSFVLGLGSQAQPVAPQAVFSFDYDVSEQDLTITHSGGDNIAVSELSVVGEHLAATGTWRELGGRASGEANGEPAVVAGDSVSVGVGGSDYVARVVWRSPDGTTSSTLAVDQGPDA